MKKESKSNREHSFDFELAGIVGLEKSILLKNIDHWVLENERRNQKQYFSNGIWWTEESLSSLVKKYPYMKKASISRWMQELHTDGWITVVVSKSGVNRYTVGEVFIAWDHGECWISKLPLSQNETAKRYPKMRQDLYQNGTVAVPKWDGSYPKMGHTNIELDIELNVDLNVEADKPQPSPKNDFSNDEIQGESTLNENPKKEKSFIGRGAKNSDGGQVSEVVKFLNETVKPACNFRESSKDTAAHIRQRVAEGFSVSDICIVIEHKNSQWRNDPKMSEYLRPATLFGTGKFEAYLVAARTWEKSGKRSASIQSTGHNQTRSVTTDFGADKDKFQQPQIF